MQLLGFSLLGICSDQEHHYGAMSASALTKSIIMEQNSSDPTSGSDVGPPSGRCGNSSDCMCMEQ